MNVLPADDGQRVLPRPEEVGDGLTREAVALVLELAQGEEMPVCVAEALEQLDRLVQSRRRAVDHFRLLARPRRDVGHLVRVDVVGGLVDVVADVVDHGREPVHVVAVEGRDERPVEQVDHLVGQPVALVLGLADVEQEPPADRPTVDQLDEESRDLPGIERPLVEEVEELALLGRQAQRHRALLPDVHTYDTAKYTVAPTPARRQTANGTSVCVSKKRIRKRTAR